MLKKVIRVDILTMMAFIGYTATIFSVGYMIGYFC